MATIECELCDFEGDNITWKHLAKHNITVEQYKKQFPTSPLMSPEAVIKKQLGGQKANASRKGIPRDETTKQKIRDTKSTQTIVPWNKGIPMDAEQKLRLSVIKKQQYDSGDIQHWNIGGSHSQETKQKISTTAKSQNRTYGEESVILRNKTLDEKKLNGWIPLTTTKDFKNKVKQICMDKYGVPYKQQEHLPPLTLRLIEDKEWLIKQHHTLKRSLLDIASELSINDSTLGRYFKKHDISVLGFFVSTAEREIVEFLQSLNIPNIITNTRDIITPLELDIYLPDFNIAIEYCGLYWHSSAHKPNTYHKNKLDRCTNKNIRLITIFEDEWVHTPDIVKEKLKSILHKSTNDKLNARQCEIIAVDSKTKALFLNQQHIQGDGPGSITYGLTHKDVLVSCMTFIRQSDGVCILNRFASSHSVRGGFSKLLSHFKKHNSWTQIVSFADLRWSEGSVYTTNGFILDKVLPPDYAYVVKDIRVHKFNYRRKNLPILLKLFDPSLSETQNTTANNIHRIYNCGLQRWVLHNMSVNL